MSIIEKTKEKFSPEFISEMATYLGESEARVSKAIAILLPATLGNICKNSGNETIVNAISEIDHENVLKNLLSESQNNFHINSIKTVLFSDDPNKLLSIVKEHSAIDITNAEIILNSVIGAIITTLKNEKQNLKSKSIHDILNEQKSLICSILPAGLSLESFGLEKNINIAEPILSDEKITEDSHKTKQKLPKAGNQQAFKNNRSFWNWLLPLLLLGIAAWFFWKIYEKQNIPDKIKIEEKK